MENLPVIVQKSPMVQAMEAGTYYWCACGLSKKQPYCDGSHKGTEFAPVKTTLESDKNVAWCACKKTNNSPFCDGSHKQL
jgi:CDGSH-type Zn-finger protein